MEVNMDFLEWLITGTVNVNFQFVVNFFNFLSFFKQPKNTVCIIHTV